MELMQYKKLAIIIVISLVAPILYAGDGEHSGEYRGLDGLSELKKEMAGFHITQNSDDSDDFNEKKDRIASFKVLSLKEKQAIIKTKLLRLSIQDKKKFLAFLQLDSESNLETEDQIEPYIGRLSSEKLTAFNIEIDNLRDEVSKEKLAQLFAIQSSKELEKQQDEPIASCAKLSEVSAQNFNINDDGQPSDVAGSSQKSHQDQNSSKEYNDNEVFKLLKDRPNAIYHEPEVPPRNPEDRLKFVQSKQIEHQLNREKDISGLQDRALVAQVTGLEREERESAELFDVKKRVLTAQADQVEYQVSREKNLSGLQDRALAAQVAKMQQDRREQKGLSKLQKQALQVQIKREEAALKRENSSFGEFVQRPEFIISMAITLTEPIYRLLVERYGNVALGFIEQKLGFGPSQEEQQFMMAQMMNNVALKSRLTRAEVNEKELKVSILRAVLKKQEIDAEKDELQLETLKAKKDILDDIAALIRERNRLKNQGLKFPASKEKELNELKYLYQENQMINKELQDLKNVAPAGISIPGLA